ncbi:MAG: DUF1361 domain-containing protein [Ignavibacteria bacterium]|nr:DUF1361 domain-containing protein [Ignavibacteria bacterium]MCC7158952.1 DUF1361 domain-containing protein [Ignavibacteria bacterium]
MSSFISSLRENNRLSVTVILALSCLLSVSLEAFRVYYSDYGTYLFLIWNLFLAILPYVISTFFLLYYKKIRSIFLTVTILSAWLLIFPNAPYIVTDFFHLEPRATVPYWFDLGLILSFAWNGLMLGFISLYDVQTALGRRFGAFKGWVFSIFSLVVGSFGIYLGRYERFNSWDVLTNPVSLFIDIADRFIHPFSHPRTMLMTLLFSIVLIFGYVTLSALFRPRRAEK